MGKSSGPRWTSEETESPYLDEPAPDAPDMRDTLGQYLERIADELPGHDDCPACADRIHPTGDRIIELRKMPYKAYLRTREWKDTRRGALARANYRCQLCGTEGKKTLNVHHLTYKRRGHEWPVDLAVLCQHCHELQHV